MSPTQGVLCQDQGLRGMGPSPGQEFLVLNIIQVFPSPLEAHGPSHLGQPLRELAAPHTAQRGCHLLERLRQEPLGRHLPGRTWGAAASLGQKQAADCLWVPRNNFLASSAIHTICCHSGTVSRTFSELDYAGIAVLIMGSFGPWLCYSHRCSPQPQLICIRRLCSGHLCHHRGTVGPVHHSQAPTDKSRSVPGA